MPKGLTNAQITQYTQDRAELEVAMCQELLEIYNTHEILEPLRQTIGTAFENVRYLVIGAPGGPKPPPPPEADITKEAVKEGKILQVFAKHAHGPFLPGELQDSLAEVAGKWTAWDAGDCSDLSRFMGSILEQKEAKVDAPAFDPIRSKFKPDEFYKNLEKPTPKVPVVSRSRTFDTSYSGKAPTTHSQAGRQAGLGKRLIVTVHGQAGKAGIDPFRLLETSTVRKIDLAFGLPEGADISGTTSDSIIINRLVGQFNASIPEELKTPGTTKLLQLLPLVTMISYGHHALVESALTLTLFGFCNYRIGFYTTLLTKGALTKAERTGNRAEVGGRILSTLKKFEEDKRNRHILCWWEPKAGKYMGEEYCTPGEVELYRSMGTTSEKFIKFFRDKVHSSPYYGDLQPLKEGVHLM